MQFYHPECKIVILKVVYYFECKLVILKVVCHSECKFVILNVKNCHPELVSGSYNKILNQGRNEDEQGWTV